MTTESPTTALRFVEAGAVVTVTHDGHPRNGQTVTALRPVDRGELKGRSTPGVWVTTGTGAVALWADTQVTR